MVASYITSDDTIKIIKSLKRSGNPNIGITSNLIIENKELFAIPLTHLYNLSISQGSFPDILKHATITPIHKSGPKNLIQNYRPISILSVYSKIIESLMKKDLLNYLSSKNILCKEQYGFRKKLNTFDALNQITDKLYTSINKHETAICVCIDFAKAFDTVKHSILLEKLLFYGIRGKIHDWFSSYLSNRSQSTKYKDCTSDPHPIEYGVPQGSVLGPLLFLIFINDLPRIFSDLMTVLFADDASFINSGTDVRALIYQTNKELQKFYIWATVNRLTINFDKTVYLIITNKRLDVIPPVYIHFNFIKQVDKHKVLGVILDKKLSFLQHIQYICKKVAKGISLLHQLKDLVPEYVLLCLYNAQILPHLLYCIPIWGSTYTTHLQPLFILQKRAIRLIAKRPYLDHTQPLFKRLKLLKLYDQIKLEIGTYMYKNRNSPDFEQCIHNYNTRHRDNIILPRHDLTKYEHSIAYAGPKLWNSLKNHIKGLPSLHSFRRNYKKELLSHY